MSVLVVAVATALGAGLVLGDQRRLTKTRDTVRDATAQAADLQTRLIGAQKQTADEKTWAAALQKRLDESHEQVATAKTLADEVQKRLDQARELTVGEKVRADDLQKRLTEALERVAVETRRADELHHRLNPPPPSPLETFLHDGTFADGETAALARLRADPTDDETRFGLGLIQFARAVENLGRALHKHGAVSENAVQPFLRLPVPKNEKPSALSYKELGRVLDAFAADLARAEGTLADVKDDKVKLRVRLANVRFDFAGTGKDRTALIDLLNRVNAGRFEFQKDNPELRVHFDRGDVAWLRAYCNLLCAMVEGYRALDMEAGFHERVGDVFPKVEGRAKAADPLWFVTLKVAEPHRLRLMRQHLVAVCKLNRETWAHVRAETDDDYEWLPHPKQGDQLGIPMTDEQIDHWLKMMAQFEDLLKGERLFPSAPIRVAFPKHKEGQGLNLKKYLDLPPDNALNFTHISENGIDAKYLEAEAGKPVFDLEAVSATLRLFEGAFGFARAARLN